MERNFWLERWKNQQIGFHEAETHPLLQRYWPQLTGAEVCTTATPGEKRGRVFVPLCGKSNDMLWLRSQGYEVLGVELSPLAVEQFFDENELSSTPSKVGEFEQFRADGYTIWCGDYFALTSDMLGPIDFIYDRASLIALPPEMREAYIAKLSVLANGAKSLLITVEYDPALLNPPPFSIPIADVEELIPARAKLETIATYEANIKGENGLEHVFIYVN